jgi:5-methylcytosine-specific restriction protein A
MPTAPPKHSPIKLPVTRHVIKKDDNRVRGRKLQGERKRLFSEQPLCVKCKEQGRITVATERDHIIALVNGGEDTPENTQPLCTECHKAKTRKDLGFKPRTTFDKDGYPTTGEHHWNEG